MTNIAVFLDSITCRDTEDIAGADEFYLVGAVSDGSTSEGIFTKPVSINDGQSKPFGVGGGRVFQADVPEDHVLKVAWVAFDADASKDWEEHGDTVKKIGGAVAGGLASIPNPYTAAAAVILPFAITAAGGIMEMDKDDNLGSHTREFPIWSLPNGSHVQTWVFRGGSGWWSSWRYAVRYRVVKGPDHF